MENQKAKDEALLSDDLKELFKDGIQTRFNDPIVSTFLISFALSNWDLLFLAFSGDASASQRISNIESAFSLIGIEAPWYTNFNILVIAHRVVLPIIATILFLFYWPKVFRVPLLAIEKHKVTRRNLTIEAQRDLINLKTEFEKISKANAEQTEEITSLNREIGGLSKELEQLKDRYNEEAKIRAEIERALEVAKEERWRTEKIAPATDALREIINTPSFQDADYQLSIMEYAKKYGVKKETAYQIYMDRIQSLVNEMKSKHPQSGSINLAGYEVENFIKGNRFNIFDDRDLFGDFARSDACDQEDKQNIYRVVSLKGHIENFRK